MGWRQEDSQVIENKNFIHITKERIETQLFPQQAKKLPLTIKRCGYAIAKQQEMDHYFVRNY